MRVSVITTLAGLAAAAPAPAFTRPADPAVDNNLPNFTHLHKPLDLMSCMGSTECLPTDMRHKAEALVAPVVTSLGRPYPSSSLAGCRWNPIHPECGPWLLPGLLPHPARPTDATVFWDDRVENTGTATFVVSQQTVRNVVTTIGQTSTEVASATSTEIISSAVPSATLSDSSDSEDEADVSLDDDLESFLNLPLYSRMAHEEEAPWPYERAFEDHNATAIHQPIETHRLEEYDATECAARCNKHRACASFAIFIERELSCTDCTDPEVTKTDMCKLYNTSLEHSVITDGQGEQDIQGQRFTRAIRASNGYNKLNQRITVTATRTVTVGESASADVSIRTTTEISYGTPYTRTVTKTETALDMETSTTTQTITQTASASPSSASPATITSSTTPAAATSSPDPATETRTQNQTFEPTSVSTTTETQTTTETTLQTKTTTISKPSI